MKKIDKKDVVQIPISGHTAVLLSADMNRGFY